jgi:hypothetical protein
MPIKLKKEIVKAPIAIFIAGSIEKSYEGFPLLLDLILDRTFLRG